MKTDDPRLEQAHKEMTARVERYNERMLTVIKNHLACEDCLNQLLASAGRKWKGKKFSGKFDIAKKEIKPSEVEPVIWDLIDAGNQLRNAVAHGHAESKIAAKMAKLREAYLAALTPFQRQHAQDLTETQLVVNGFGLGGAFIIAAAEAEKGRKTKSKAAKAAAHL
jgi:maltooligosyltrehalose synthase